MSRKFVSLFIVAILALLCGCAGNSIGRRQPEKESLTLRMEFLQTQLESLRIDVRDLEHQIAELQRQIREME